VLVALLLGLGPMEQTNYQVQLIAK
jgi:hypothetical protein